MYCIITIYTQNNQGYDKGTPCDVDRIDLPAGSPPPPCTTATNDDYSPFLDRPNFKLTDFLFTQQQMPGKGVNCLMEILATKYRADDVPYVSQDNMYSAIDLVEIANAPWQSFSACYTGDIPEGEPPPWMLTEYDVWYHNPQTVLRNQLANPDFNGEIDLVPKQKFGVDGKRRYQDFMSGIWSWRQAVSADFLSFNDD